MKTLTKTMSLSLALAVGALALGGCSASGGGATKLNVDAPVTLTWWTGQADQPEKLLEGFAKEFEHAHPNVKINVSPGAPTTDDLLQKISASFISGNYPDVSYAYGAWTGELGASGKALDITSQVADKKVDWNGFPLSGRETASPDGKTIGFPAIIDDLNLLYNKDLFDAAGLAYPTNDWTWDQFAQAAKALTNTSTQTYGYGYPTDGTTGWRFYAGLWQRGGDVLSSDKSKTAFNSRAGIDAVNALKKMAVTDKSVFLDDTAQKFEPLFVSGRIGMILDGPWELYTLKEAKTNYGVAYLPGVNGNHETVSGPDIWALFDHKDANRAYWSFQLTKWLTDPAQDERYNIELGNLPLRPDASKDSPEYKKALANYPGFDVMVANLANVKHSQPVVAGFAGVQGALRSAIAGVLESGKDTKAALQEAARNGDLALKKAAK